MEWRPIISMILHYINFKNRDAIGQSFLSEGFEGSLSNYRQVYGQAMMSISKQYAHSGNGSLTSDSNNTSIQCIINPYLQDSIAGLQFYIMATKKSKTNTMVGIYKSGSNANGIYTTMGMGISKSDSLEYIYEAVPDEMDIDKVNLHTNFAALELNKWYLCKVEYDYNTSILEYFLNNTVIHTMIIENPFLLSSFVAMRDGAGAQGPSGYYIDDVIVYKR
jgi:hypothetical protein